MARLSVLLSVRLSVRVAALAVLAAALLSTALPAAASAGGSASAGRSGNDLGLTVPGNQSAGDQYVETLPTTKGPRAPGRRKHAKKLSHGITKKLQKQGGSDAATLQKLSTSTALGAPVDAGSNGKGSHATGSQGGSNGGGSQEGRSRNGKRHGGSAPAIPSAAINAVDGGEAGLGWLVLGILAITALSLGAVGYQRHRDKGSAE
jgi:hypothetical protein